MRAQIPAYAESLRHTLEARVEWQATLHSRHLERRESATYLTHALSATERQAALAQTPTLDFSSEVFQQWLKTHHLRKTPSESDLDFARRAFLLITHTLRY